LSERAFKLLVIFLSIIAALYLVEKIWQLLSWLSEIILMLALAWLITFILEPVVHWLTTSPLPIQHLPLPKGWNNSTLVRRISGFHLPHGAAVALVYLALLTLVSLSGALFLPSTVQQSIQLGAKLPEYIRKTPELLMSLQQTLARFNVQIDLVSLAQSPELIRQAQNLGTNVVQFALNLAAGVASTLTKAFLVLTLSFYMMLEQKKISALIWQLIPPEIHDEAQYAFSHFQRIFGAYVRGEALVAVLYGLGVATAMQIAGLNFALVIGAFCGLMTMIPYLGDPVAMFLPPLITLFQQPGEALWVLISLALYQQVLVRFLLPKIVSEATGMPAMLVILSILIGVKLIGFWGFVFAIPVAGMIYAMGLYFLEKHRQGKK